MHIYVKLYLLLTHLHNLQLLLVPRLYKCSNAGKMHAKHHKIGKADGAFFFKNILGLRPEYFGLTGAS